MGYSGPFNAILRSKAQVSVPKGISIGSAVFLPTDEVELLHRNSVVCDVRVLCSNGGTDRAHFRRGS